MEEQKIRWEIEIKMEEKKTRWRNRKRNGEMEKDKGLENKIAEGTEN